MIWHRTGSNSETLVHLIASDPLPPEATLGMSLFFLMSSLPSLAFFFLKETRGIPQQSSCWETAFSLPRAQVQFPG